MENKIERIPEVLSRTGLSRSGLYAAIRARSFAAPIKISARSVGFLSSEVDAWIAERAALRALG